MLIGIIVVAIVLLALIVAFVLCSRKDKKMGAYICFACMTIVTIVALAAPFVSLTSDTYRVVYHEGNKIVAIDDENGSTYTLSEDGTFHIRDDYAKDDQIQVITDMFGRTIFFTPATMKMEASTTPAE